MSNLIKLIYSLNNEESVVAFDPTNKIISLKTLINLTQKINLDDYEVFYKKKEIKWIDENPIRTIIGKENVPIFYIKSKLNKDIENFNLEKKVDNTKKETERKVKEEKKIEKPQDNKSPNANEELSKPKEHNMNTNSKNIDFISVTQNEKQELINLKCKVMVENFPSRPEFLEIIKKFEENKQVKNEMSLLNSGSGIQITFKNPVKNK